MIHLLLLSAALAADPTACTPSWTRHRPGLAESGATTWDACGRLIDDHDHSLGTERDHHQQSTWTWEGDLPVVREVHWTQELHASGVLVDKSEITEVGWQGDLPVRLRFTSSEGSRPTGVVETTLRWDGERLVHKRICTDPDSARHCRTTTWTWSGDRLLTEHRPNGTRSHYAWEGGAPVAEEVEVGGEREVVQTARYDASGQMTGHEQYGAIRTSTRLRWNDRFQLVASEHDYRGRTYHAWMEELDGRRAIRSDYGSDAWLRWDPQDRLLATGGTAGEAALEWSGQCTPDLAAPSFAQSTELRVPQIDPRSHITPASVLEYAGIYITGRPGYGPLT